MSLDNFTTMFKIPTIILTLFQSDLSKINNKGGNEK